MSHRIVGGLAALFVLVLAPAAVAVNSGPVELVSVDPTGAIAGDDQSGSIFGRDIDVSSTGRWVVFASDASNLVPTDTNGTTDVFLRDLHTGQTTLISENLAGTDSGNGASLMPVISDDGRHIAFVSFATDLHTNDLDGFADVFILNRNTGVLTLASVAHGGFGSGNGDSLFPSISADGGAVAFETEATNLSSIDFNGEDDIYLWVTSFGFPILASVNGNGNSGNDDSTRPQISADGNRVAFRSDAEDLHPLDTNLRRDVFVYELSSNDVFLVGMNAAGTASGNDATTDFDFARGGSGVAFRSTADDLVATDTNGLPDIFYRDLDTGTTELISINFAGTDSCLPPPMTPSVGIHNRGPRVSADGNVVAFHSECGDALDPAIADTNGDPDLFARDRGAGVTSLVSHVPGGASTADEGTVDAWISADGQVIAFNSYATNLAPLVGNGAPNIFLSYLRAGRVELASPGAVCPPLDLAGGQCGTHLPTVSKDGRRLLFFGNAPGFTANNTNGSIGDVFAARTAFLFEDGFESGDTTAWDVTVP